MHWSIPPYLSPAYESRVARNRGKPEIFFCSLFRCSRYATAKQLTLNIPLSRALDRGGSVEKEYVVAIIGVVGTLLGTIVGFFLSFVFERVQKNLRMKDDLRAAINRAQLVTVVNKYPVVLSKLKDAIDANAHALHKNSTITGFYSKWLCDPSLAMEEEFMNFIPQERIQELKDDLAAIKV